MFILLVRQKQLLIGVSCPNGEATALNLGPAECIRCCFHDVNLRRYFHLQANILHPEHFRHRMRYRAFGLQGGEHYRYRTTPIPIYHVTACLLTPVL